MPDAVIVADIGLMKLLSEKFPNLALHASTQYGAYTINDIEFLKRYNITRVILARELTLSEIKKIRASTDIELEAFAYGSQCICFSGQCLWSGLIHECSANRGRCLAPCRDFFQQKNCTGHFLYPQDIDACAIVKDLINAGVDGLKLEGRFRDAATTSLAVKRFRKAIFDCTNESAEDVTSTNEFAENVTSMNEFAEDVEKSYCGYLSNEIPVKSMFHVLNPRVVLHGNPDTPFGEHDFLVKFDKGRAVTITTGANISDTDEYSYLKTIFYEKLNLNNDAAWASLSFKEGILDKIEVFDNLGRQFTYRFLQQDLVKTTPKDIVATLKNFLSFNIREIFSNVPAFSSVQINSSAFKDVLSKLNESCNVVPKPVINTFVAPSAEDYIQINSVAVMQYLKELGYRKFIFDIMSAKDLNEVTGEKFSDCLIIYRLPLLDFNAQQENILDNLKDKNVMITRPMQLTYKEKYGFKKMFADYTLNVWNSKSLAVLKDFEVEMFVAHPEPDISESKAIAKNANISVGVLYAGKIPLGYTRACFKEMKLCDGNCANGVWTLKNVTKGYTLQIRCNENFGLRTILPSTIGIAGKDISSCVKIYNFSYLNAEEIRSLLSGKLDDLSKICVIYGRGVL